MSDGKIVPAYDIAFHNGGIRQNVGQMTLSQPVSTYSKVTLPPYALLNYYWVMKIVLRGVRTIFPPPTLTPLHSSIHLSYFKNKPIKNLITIWLHDFEHILNCQ